MNATTILYIALAALCGLATAYQPGVNARFARHSGTPLHGGVANFAVGLAAMLAVCLIFRAAPPPLSRSRPAPWWAYVGGMLGAFFVTMAIILAPRMGTANYIAAMIFGQMVGSAVIDHFGHMGLPIHAFTPGRALGIGLIFAGVVCVRVL